MPADITIKPLPVASKPRLRFDRVVLELIGRLQARCTPIIPDDRTVVFTCTAPIRLSGKTAVEIEQRIRAALARDARRDVTATVHENAIRIRFVRARVKGGARLAGFVHNPDPAAAEVLLGMTQALIEALASVQGSRKRRLVIENPSATLGPTWRHVYAALAPPPRHQEVLMQFADGTVQNLTGDDDA